MTRRTAPTLKRPPPSNQYNPVRQRRSVLFESSPKAFPQVKNGLGIGDNIQAKGPIIQFERTVTQNIGPSTTETNSWNRLLIFLLQVDIFCCLVRFPCHGGLFFEMNHFLSRLKLHPGLTRKQSLLQIWTFTSLIMRHVTYVLLDEELVQLVQSSKSTSFFLFRHVPNAWARPMTPLSLGRGT